MINKRIEEEAQMHVAACSCYPCGATEEEMMAIERINRFAFIDGANFALSHQWVSVEDALPTPMQRVLVWIGDEALVCWYTKGGKFITTLRSQERYSKDKLLDVKIHLSPCREDVTDIATHWLPIPLLNPEKEER